MTRIVTVGTDGASCRAALAAAEDFPQVYAAIGRHPNSATGFDDADLAELEALAAHPKCVAIGETGLDYYRDYAPARRSAARLRGADRARARDRQAAGDPHARGRRRHAGDAVRPGQGVRVILHCFSMARAARGVPRATRLVALVRRQRHVPEGRGPAAAALRVPPSGCWSRPTPRTCPRRRCAASPTSPPTWFTPRRRWRSSGGSAYEELEAAIDAQRGRGVRMVGTRSVRAAGSELPRRPQHPRRDRAPRRARRPTTSCWRSEAGRACCPSGWPPRAAHVHVVEVDRRLETGCAMCSGRFANVTLHMADALEVDLAALDPAPTKVVANLPYGIAATVILRTIAELPGVDSWVVMVQREVGERLAAEAGDARPTASPRCSHSSRVTSRCCGPWRGRCFARSRTSTRCWSDCAATAATDPACARSSTRRSLTAARRSRARWRWLLAPAAGVRERARAALVEMGHPADERAERLSPDEFRELAVRLGS